MKYTKPEVVELGKAIDAIQGSKDLSIDAPGGNNIGDCEMDD